MVTLTCSYEARERSREEVTVVMLRISKVIENDCYVMQNVNGMLFPCLKF